MEVEHGAVLVEMAMVLSGLLLGLALLVDTCNMLAQYTLLQQSAHEGYRLASVLPGLERGEYSNVMLNSENQEQIARCLEKRPTRFPCEHYLTQDRIRVALEELGAFDSTGLWFNPRDAAEVDITTSYAAEGSGGEAEDSVSVDIRGRYRGLIFVDVMLSADVQGAYLYQELG